MLFSVALECSKRYDELLDLAVRAENCGFHSVQIYEHMINRPAWPLAFLIASRTRRVAVGPVTVPSFAYDPFTLARLVQSLAEFAGERALIGVSRGAFSETMGTGRPKVRDFVGYLRTLADLLCCRTGPCLDWWTRRTPAILVGTSGPRLISEVCKLPFVKGIVVDGLWNTDYARFLVDVIRRSLSEAGREREGFEVIARPFCCICDDRRRALEFLGPVLRKYLWELVGRSPMLSFAGVGPDELRYVSWDRPDKRLEDLIGNFAFFGPAEDFAEGCREISKAGVDHVCIGLPIGPDPRSALTEVSRALGLTCK
ncbi:MAG: LLM class flavin-dependent oxidoreductase [Nitrososphaerota archaeon]